MERESGNSVLEKDRLRDLIQSQVRRYLERGGRITVIGNGGDRPGRIAQVVGASADLDLYPEFD